MFAVYYEQMHSISHNLDFIKECVAIYNVNQPNVMHRVRNNTFCQTELKYFYNAESKYRSLKKLCFSRKLCPYFRDYFG